MIPESKVREALSFLSEEKVIAYPTETFYGLGADGHNPEAIETIQRLKGREGDRPFPVLLPNRESLGRYVEKIPAVAELLIDRFWPGPLTVVLPCSNLPQQLIGKTGGVGFRVSSHPVASILIRAFGRCVTTTSANLSGRPPARLAKEVSESFAPDEVYVLDGGGTPGGQPSTVIDLTDAEHPTVIREGAIPWPVLTSIMKGL